MVLVAPLERQKTRPDWTLKLYAYEDLFNEHLEELNKFDEFTKVMKILPAILQELHNEGRCIINYFFIKYLILSF